MWTIGYGRHWPHVGPGVSWTQEQCDSALTNRLQNEFEPAVNAAGPASQQQFDAMVCLAYNIGAGGFAGSTVARRARRGSLHRRGRCLPFMWDKAGGEVLASRCCTADRPSGRSISAALIHKKDPAEAGSRSGGAALKTAFAAREPNERDHSSGAPWLCKRHVIELCTKGDRRCRRTQLA